MLQKTALIGLLVACATLLCFMMIVGGSLCEIQLNGGSFRLFAKLAYEVR
ncbi:TPA: Hok/Gef family protein [Vibrio parahaemolyticus]|uniref:Hok/Gef family protein n=1 Tax=Vibrio parahaemolyticus TaxID=670 RepID=A0AAW8Q172_VIBPH|nr:Hok/Gef family protein [Vibrio parahaemolyticus]MDS1821025.1 Hok/Gef family protein [Vibrio parahaemolyticus]